ncbi:MAG: undecaprenyl diphosphate synthase family protein, partial [Eggerthellaceae bacterium]|nr:undecaprenyl diphosphate synthase family protein [Eggerthellaceae bacterium]
MAYLALVSGICAGEFYYMMRVDARLPNELIGIAGAALYPVAMWRFGMPGIGIVTFLLMLALLVWYVYYMRARIPDLGVSFFGAAYTGMTLNVAVNYGSRDEILHAVRGVVDSAMATA